MCNSTNIGGCCPPSQFVSENICGIFDADFPVDVFNDFTGFHLTTITIKADANSAPILVTAITPAGTIILDNGLNPNNSQTQTLPAVKIVTVTPFTEDTIISGTYCINVIRRLR
ncbi:S-Ena type endospore appendage [Bacillus toyonensis]|uniref:S-Ena type endospore appendage n=1 Tax=Bacillus toyonensis TaxID=155322 RepID=UPI000BFDE2F3|nr:S-Ena type endospore appendage [Bacillus toyonensis]PHG57793.1 hypothetical protein COI59_29055 [Bacillus toyonensis]